MSSDLTFFDDAKRLIAAAVGPRCLPVSIETCRNPREGEASYAVRLFWSEPDQIVACGETPEECLEALRMALPFAMRRLGINQRHSVRPARAGLGTSLAMAGRTGF